MATKTSADIRPAQAVMNQITDTMRRSPGLMATAADRRYRKVRPLIKADMKLSPRQPPLPMIWSYNPAAQARARRWYFANMVPKGSTGGRYKRTGKLEAATEVTGNFTKTDGVITIENATRGALFVFGARQVPGHALAGHPRLAEVADKWRVLLGAQLSEDWFTVTDITAGVRP